MALATPLGISASDVAALRAAARQTLRANRRRVPLADGRLLHFSCPSPGHYPFQWFWDSAFHAVALAHVEQEAAREELLLLFSAQQDDGFIPHVVFWDRRQLLRSQLYWCWMQSRGFGLPRSSALIQPPVIAAAVERYVQVTGDVDLARQLLPCLDRYFTWLGRVRGSASDGLLTIIAPWESGMDHKPSYDMALGLDTPAPPRQVILEPRMVDIANRAAGYRNALTRRGRFRVVDVLVNAVYVDGLRSLGRLHQLTGPAEAAWDQQAAATERALIARCRGKDGFFYDLDRRTGRQISVRTVGGLCALLLDGLDGEAAAPLLNALADPAAFALPFPAPSVAAGEPAFVPGAQHWRAGPLIWRGPTWINTNWLLIRALRRRGLHLQADSLARASASLVLGAGFREFYHPYSGEGLGARSFGWSTLIVDMLAGV